MPVNLSEKKLFDLLAAETLNNPPKPLSELTLEEFRSAAPLFLKYAGKPAAVKYKEKFITARDGYQIPIRIYNYALKKTSPVLIFYPGSAYIIDTFETNSIAASRIANFSGVKVIVVNYRLAPEHPLPISIYDSYDVTRYVAKHSKELNIDSEKIFIGGISSGAHCAAVISNLVAKNKEFSIYHQILLNGTYDLTNTNHDYDDFEKEDKIFTRDSTAFIFQQWGLKSKDLKNPLFSPFYETDFKNLARTTLIVGEYDGLRNDSEAYYKKLKAAGVKVEKILLPGQTHNTLVMRAAMTDGEDPAKVMADVILKNLQTVGTN